MGSGSVCCRGWKVCGWNGLGVGLTGESGRNSGISVNYVVDAVFCTQCWWQHPRTCF